MARTKKAAWGEKRESLTTMAHKRQETHASHSRSQSPMASASRSRSRSRARSRSPSRSRSRSRSRRSPSASRSPSPKRKARSRSRTPSPKRSPSPRKRSPSPVKKTVKRTKKQVRKVTTPSASSGKSSDSEARKRRRSRSPRRSATPASSSSDKKPHRSRSREPKAPSKADKKQQRRRALLLGKPAPASDEEGKKDYFQSLTNGRRNELLLRWANYATEKPMPSTPLTDLERAAMQGTAVCVTAGSEHATRHAPILLNLPTGQAKKWIWIVTDEEGAFASMLRGPYEPGILAMTMARIRYMEQQLRCRLLQPDMTIKVDPQTNKYYISAARFTEIAADTLDNKCTTLDLEDKAVEKNDGTLQPVALRTHEGSVVYILPRVLSKLQPLAKVIGQEFFNASVYDILKELMVRYLLGVGDSSTQSFLVTDSAIVAHGYDENRTKVPVYDKTAINAKFSVNDAMAACLMTRHAGKELCTVFDKALVTADINRRLLAVLDTVEAHPPMDLLVQGKELTARIQCMRFLLGQMAEPASDTASDMEGVQTNGNDRESSEMEHCRN